MLETEIIDVVAIRIRVMRFVVVVVVGLRKSLVIYSTNDYFAYRYEFKSQKAIN